MVARTRRLRFGRRLGSTGVAQDVPLPAQVVYTQRVLTALTELRGDIIGDLFARVAQGGIEDPTANRWVQATDHLHGKVIGFMVLQPDFVAQPWQFLEEECQDIRDFWMFTTYHSWPLTFCQVTRSFIGAEGVAVQAQAEHLSRHSRYWFFQVSDHSFSKLVEAFPAAADLATQLAVYVPCPHALLLLQGTWLRYGFPRVLQGRQAGAWFQGRELLEAAGVAGPAQNISPAEIARRTATWTLDPENILRLGANLRDLINPTSPESIQAAMSAATDHMLVLHKIRERMLLQSARMSQNVYDLEQIVQFVMIASGLRSAEHMDVLLRQCLHVCVQDPTIRNHFEARLSQERAVPSPTTLRRHRLTLLMGFQRVRARMLDEMLDRARGSGIVRWSTIDASPHKGYDFVLQGHSTRLVDELPEAWRHAEVLLLQEPNDAANLGQETSSRKFLKPRLELVPGVPTAVGSGRASVLHKIKAAAHSERLQANSWGQVAVLMNSTFSRTGDLGTESRMCGWEGNLDVLMGTWVADADGVKEVEPGFNFQQVSDLPLADEEPEFDIQPCEVVPVSADARPHYRLDFTQQVFIAGLLHISHNMTRDLESVLQHWETYVTQLTHVCRLLQQPWSCQRLVRTCMQRPPWSAWVPQVEEFDGKVYQGRWGTTMDAITQLVPLLHVVRQVWDAEKFSRKAGGTADDAGDTEASRQLSLEVVQQALSSDLFVAYSHAMLSIANAVLHLQNWAESCPCKRHSSDELKQTCPLKTRRAPELAAGALYASLKSELDVAHGGLLANETMVKLRDEQQQLVLVDFAAARQHIDLSLRVKLSHWQQLPHILFGLGHHNESVRARCAKRSLQLFDSVVVDDEAGGDATQIEHHHLSSLLCTLGTAARHEMEQIARGGADMMQMRVLLPWAARFRFTPVAERWVEGLHASAKRHSRAAPHAGPVHLAFESALPFLKKWLQENAAANSLQALAQHCKETKNLRRCLTGVGCFQHPVIQQLLQEHGNLRTFSRKAVHACVEVLFHCDAASHFEAIPDALLQQRTQKVMPTNWSLPSARNDSLEDELWAKHALQGLKDFVRQQTRSDSQADVQGPISLSSKLMIVSLNSSSPTTFPLALQSFVNPTPQTALAIEDMFQFLALEDGQPAQANQPDNDEASAAESRTQNISFFRIAQLNPGQAKTVAGVARVSGQDTLIVELLPVFRFDARGGEAVVGLEGDGSRAGTTEDCSGSLYVLDAIHYPSNDLLGMQSWQYDPKLHFDLDGAIPDVDPELSQAIREVLTDVMRGQAFAKRPESAAFVLRESEAPPNMRGEAVTRLADMGVLVRVPPNHGESSDSHWKITEFGLRKVATAHRLHSPLPVFSAPSDAEVHVKANLSVVQLMLYLRQKGWACAQKVSRHTDPEPYKPAPDSVKMWWIKASTQSLNAFYLLALATAGSHGKDVPHFKNQSVYKQILGLEEEATRARGRRSSSQFAFVSVQDPAILPLPKPKARRAKAKQRPARGAGDRAGDRRALQDDECRPDPAEDGDGDAEEGSADSLLNAMMSADEDVPSQSSSSSSNSSSSSSSSSASSSSSSSSGGSAGSSDEGGDPADDDGAAGARRIGHAHATALLSTTFFWKGCRFTMLKVGQQHVGWECTCRDPRHRDVGNACRRSLRFTRHGGQDMVLRKLKWWLLQSYDYDTRADHVTTCPWVPLLGVDYLPSRDELESQRLGYDVEQEPPAAPKAAASRKAKAKPALAKAKNKAKAKAKAKAEPASSAPPHSS